ncbi:hypothetical protein ABZ318_34065, partial [Streptomyces sp. NPDC006197]|uniref:hypothetical protein n=1 Tax=Streptomyces sp. NPDC006197 TaxID=3156685 RepID=UPI0033AED234
AHPFTSLLVPARALRERHGPEHVHRLRDAYLDRAPPIATRTRPDRLAARGPAERERRRRR